MFAVDVRVRYMRGTREGVITRQTRPGHWFVKWDGCGWDLPISEENLIAIY
jgi:hypothetical protein